MPKQDRERSFIERIHNEFADPFGRARLSYFLDGSNTRHFDHCKLSTFSGKADRYDRIVPSRIRSFYFQEGAKGVCDEKVDRTRAAINQRELDDLIVAKRTIVRTNNASQLRSSLRGIPNTRKRQRDDEKFILHQIIDPKRMCR